MPTTVFRVAASCAMLLGCASDPPAPPLDPAQEFAQRAWPALAQCVGCHATQPGIDFLAPGTPEGAYATVFGFQPPVLDMGSPAASLLLTMGQHTGPALTDGAAHELLQWLDAERTARIGDPGDAIKVGPFAPTYGFAVLADLGPPGARLTFVPDLTAQGLAFRGFAITAGAKGLHVVHPLVTGKPTLGPLILDAADRYRDLDLDIAPNTTELIGGGDALYGNLAADPIVIYFRTLQEEP